MLFVLHLGIVKESDERQGNKSLTHNIGGLRRMSLFGCSIPQQADPPLAPPLLKSNASMLHLISDTAFGVCTESWLESNGNMTLALTSWNHTVRITTWNGCMRSIPWQADPAVTPAMRGGDVV